MNSLKSDTLLSMLKNGADAIANEVDYINQLNIFPVPDGDTGANLMATTTGAYNDIKDQHFTDIFSLCKAYSRALLMNARGNSGVIFSQIMKGFFSVVTPNKKEITIVDLTDAFKQAKVSAYTSVVRPVEGTMLTVIRVIAEKITSKGRFNSVESLIEFANTEGNIILKQTPNFLKELRDAGVVDSGGYGLCCFLSGMLQAISSNQKVQQKDKSTTNTIKSKDFTTSGEEGFGYCCEFIMQLKTRVSVEQKHKKDFHIEEFKSELSEIGDSLVVVKDEDIVKVHVHSIKPYSVLEIGSQYGEFEKVKIENMTLQFLKNNPGTTLETMNKSQQNALSNKIKIIATVPSQQFVDIYKNQFGITNTINTQIHGNPSIQEFVSQIRDAESSNIIILVDDSNVVMAASEAAKLVENNVRCEVINARNIASSYRACLIFNPINEWKTNIKKIINSIKRDTVASISTSIKNIEFSGTTIKKNDYIGIIGKKIIAADKDLLKTIQDTCNILIKYNKKATKASIFYGANVGQDSIKFVKKYLMEKLHLKINLIRGDQPTYLFYISIF